MTASSEIFSHKFHPTILRAYDIRGIIGNTLAEEDAFAIGALFANCLDGSLKKVAVGRDGRLSSPALSKALIDGLIAGGAHVIDIGLGPTPQLYFADRILDCDGAIQITGSHNPKDYNGFKMVKTHLSFYGDDIQKLGQMGRAGVMLTHDGSYQEHSVFDDYISKLADGLAHDERPLIWDTGNGAAGPAVAALIEKLKGTHHLLFAEVDGNFPNHHPDPVDPHTLGFLRDARDEMNADCGLGFDGDGDRLGVIDAKGRQVPGDLLTAFLALEYLQRKPGAEILFDVKSSQTAMTIVRQAGGVASLWKTGHSHMKSRMVETGCELAGEMSGHIFIKDGYYGFDDALYVAVRLLQTMHRTGQTITDFMDNLPQSFASPECRVPCDDERKFADMTALADAAMRQFSDRDVIVIDGVRVMDETGWWLIRASNTEAALVVRAEGVDETALATKVDELQSLLSQRSISWDGPDS